MLDRSKMLWFGRPPSNEDFRETRNRGLTLEVVDLGTPPDFRHACAAVFWASNQHFVSVAELLEENLVQAVNEGLYLHIVVANDGQRQDIDRVLDQLLPPGAPRDRHRLRVLPVDFHEAPNAALLHVSGPAANSRLLVHLPDGVTLQDDQRFLLRRAFSDCKSISLRLINSGKSGALTFLVDATLAVSNAGLRPQPYFAKLGETQELREELQKYETFAEHHIAWNLRPNFQRARCIYGVKQSVLVGNFVQSSLSLWDVARTGEGPAHIRTLFEETLSVWRNEAKRWPLEQPGAIVAPLEAFCRYSRVSSIRVEAAKVHGGVVHPARSLWRKLLDLPHQHWLHSSIHGDMHGENVRVRKQDAIVIDFAHSTSGPMCADLASLEVWLAFKVPPDEMSTREEWRKRLEELYRPDLVDEAMSATAPETPNNWVQDCLREIRRIAGASTEGADEYKRVLAVCLLRHASFPPDEGCEEEDEYRRTYSYWLANRMVDALCAAASWQLEAV